HRPVCKFPSVYAVCANGRMLDGHEEAIDNRLHAPAIFAPLLPVPPDELFFKCLLDLVLVPGIGDICDESALIEGEAGLCYMFSLHFSTIITAEIGKFFSADEFFFLCTDFNLIQFFDFPRNP